MREKFEQMRKYASLRRTASRDTPEDPKRIPHFCMQELMENPSIFYNHSSSRTPLIITNISSRAGLPSWANFKLVAENCGGPNKEVPVKTRTGGSNSWAGLTFGGNVNIVEYLNSTNRQSSFQENRYLHDLSIVAHCPKLVSGDDFRIPHFFASDALQVIAQRLSRDARRVIGDYADYWPSLFVGSLGTSSALHADWAGTSAWMGVLKGSKWWILVAEDDRDMLDVTDANPNAFVGDLLHKSRGAPDEELSRKIRHWDDVVYADEIIYIPSRVPHQVENLETPTVAVAFNFVEPRNVDVFVKGAEEMASMLPSHRGWRAYREIAAAAAALIPEYAGKRDNCVGGNSMLSELRGVRMDKFRKQKLCRQNNIDMHFTNR